MQQSLRQWCWGSGAGGGGQAKGRGQPRCAIAGHCGSAGFSAWAGHAVELGELLSAEEGFFSTKRGGVGGWVGGVCCC